MMKAVGTTKALSIDVPNALLDIDVPVPQIGLYDLLVRVEAISVNPADYRSRLRKVDDGQLAILGWDAAGTVVSVGANAMSQFEVGDLVYYAGDTSRPGSNCELHAVDSRIVGHRPKTISAAAAAAMPLTTLTAWEALFDRMGFFLTGGNRLKSLLIIGGAGGVGSMAIQIARLIPNLKVIATASRAESKSWCLTLGAHAVIDHSKYLIDELSTIGLNSVDAILLLNSPDLHFKSAAECLSPQGILCCIVPFSKPQDLNILMRKSITFAWELMFTRPLFNTDDMSKQSFILNSVCDLVNSGKLVSPMRLELSPFSAATVMDAHRRLETNRTIGKISISGFDETAFK